jgi:hypothetical protein
MKVKIITDECRSIRTIYNPLNAWIPNAWLPPRKSAKLIPPKLEQPKIPNYAEINKSFRKFCHDSGYIC